MPKALQMAILPVLAVALAGSAANALADEPVRVGWIGAMTGPFQKYGAYQAALLAQEEVNARGGINGRPLKLIYEDGRCDGRAAVTAANKLLYTDHVRLIVGGHCSPESAAIAPLGERNGAVLLAAITTSPKLSIPDDNFFRLSTASPKVVEVIAPYAVHELKLGRIGVVYADTDYAGPAAEHFASLVRGLGAVVTGSYSFAQGETDFRSLLLRFKSDRLDGLYIGTQSPETARLIIRQLNDLGIKVRLLGNEVTGGAGFESAGQFRPLFGGLIFAEPEFDPDTAESRDFIVKFKAKYNVDHLPYGVYTAEAFDAVMVMSRLIADCGEAAAEVRRCLSALSGYRGASGTISIDENGDGVRTAVIRKIEGGKIISIKK